MQDEYAALRLKNQLCFPIYAVANLIVRKYKPLLDELGLTYTQYIVMMVLWEEGRTNEKQLCSSLCLRSNTLAPLLKKLQEKGFVQKEKDQEDGRNLVITLTPAGLELREKALSVPGCMAKKLHIKQEDAMTLYRILYEILDDEKENEQ